jgi:hypothetical protein
MMERVLHNNLSGNQYVQAVTLPNEGFNYRRIG